MGISTRPAPGDATGRDLSPAPLARSDGLAAAASPSSDMTRAALYDGKGAL